MTPAPEVAIMAKAARNSPSQPERFDHRPQLDADDYLVLICPIRSAFVN